MDRRRYLWVLIVVAAGAVSTIGLTSPATGPGAQSSASTAGLSTESYMDHVEFLAGPEMRGRGNGTEELERAAEHLAAQFRGWGLEPAGENGTYFQRFELTTDTETGPGSELTLGTEQLRLDSDFAAVRFTTRDTVEGPLVFVGYGITAPEMHWDDYGDVDVNGKIVIAFRHEPQERDEDSPFAGTEFTSHATFMNKAINAKQHGARGILFLLDPNNHRGVDEDVEDTALRTETDNSGIAAAYVRMEPVLSYFEQAGFDLRQMQREIDQALEPRSFEFPGSRARLVTDVTRVRKPVRNVMGAIEGSDPDLKDEWVIAGAHYDHLGLDGSFSRARNADGQIHHGADDNASGTAGILELARIAAENRESFRRSVLFMAFAGEELGLLGSSHFVNHPTVDLDKTAAMINLDMIGRLRDDRVFVGGVGTSPDFRDLLERFDDGLGLRLEYSDSGMGASDHMSFNIKRIPILFFFSGLHGDYHRPSDTSEKINAGGAQKVLTLAYRMIEHLAGEAERPIYTRVEEPRTTGSGAGGYGPYFGSVPDFRDDLNGVMFADVASGSPADEAGFVSGDVLVEFNGKPIQNLYDFTYALQAEQPGTTVVVIVERAGERISAEVTLGAR